MFFFNLKAADGLPLKFLLLAITPNFNLMYVYVFNSFNLHLFIYLCISFSLSVNIFQIVMSDSFI